MEWNWTAIGAFAAVAAVLVSIWVALRRQRRPVVVLLASKTRVGLASTSDRLGMTWDGVPIADPWLVTLTVVNESRDDIPSARFDRDRPLVLSLGTAEVKDALSVSFDGEPWSLPADESRGAVEFRPYLIQAGARLEIQLVVAGEPALDWREPLSLIDVDTAHSVTASGASRAGAPTVAVGFSFGFLGLGLVAAVIGANAERELAIVLLAILLTSLVGASAASLAAALMVSSRSH